MAQRSTPCGISLGACRIRITLLDDTGCISGSTNNSFVLGDFIQIQATPNVETGTDITLLGGCGCKIASFKDSDKLKRFDFEIQNPTVAVALYGLMLGGTIGYDDSTIPVPVGVAWPTDLGCGEEPPHVALEFWTKNWVNDAQDTELPWIHHVYPQTLWQIGQQTYNNDFAQPTLVGFSRQNTCWGDGPYGDGFESVYGTTFDISTGGFFYTDVDPPDASCDLENVTPAS